MLRMILTICQKRVMSASHPAAINTADALRQAYAAGQRYFSGITLTHTNLSQLTLKGSDLSYTDLSHTDLSQANLRGVDFSYAMLRGTNLSQADLRGAMLIGTDLRDATLSGANLDAADYDPDETQFPSGFDPTTAGMRADR